MFQISHRKKSHGIRKNQRGIVRIESIYAQGYKLLFKKAVACR